MSGNGARRWSAEHGEEEVGGVEVSSDGSLTPSQPVLLPQVDCGSGEGRGGGLRCVPRRHGELMVVALG